jgi:hypothetical protein
VGYRKEIAAAVCAVAGGFGATPSEDCVARIVELFREHGITVTDRTIRFADIYRVTEKTGIEYGLTREVIGGQPAYRLYSGGADWVTMPRGGGVRVIGHTHTSGSRLPSAADINNINAQFLRSIEANPLAPVPHRRVIWGPGTNESTIYHPNVLR